MKWFPLALAVFNIALGLWYTWQIRRVHRLRQQFKEAKAQLEGLMESLATLPDFHKSMNVAGFLGWLSSDLSGAPDAIRQMAKELLPLDIEVNRVAQDGKIHLKVKA
jgi:hypothetical protein